MNRIRTENEFLSYLLRFPGLMSQRHNGLYRSVDIKPVFDIFSGAGNHHPEAFRAGQKIPEAHWSMQSYLPQVKVFLSHFSEWHPGSRQSHWQ